MAKSKYQEYYQKMIDENRLLFDEFALLCQAYEQKTTDNEEAFHQLGGKVLDVIRVFDRRLCSAMGRGVYSQYSQTLSEKFWSLIRQDFPQIDMVGVRIKKQS